MLTGYKACKQRRLTREVADEISARIQSLNGNRGVMVRRMGKCTGYFGNLRVPVRFWAIVSL